MADTDIFSSPLRFARIVALTGVGLLLIHDRTIKGATPAACVICFFGLFLLFAPYGMKQSIFLKGCEGCSIHEHEKHRSFSDKLVWSSLIYFLAAIFSFSVGQAFLGFMQTTASIGSTLYHLNREMMFFNLDNIFATALLFVFAWAMFLSFWNDLFFFLFSIAGMPIAIFLLVYCGLPACVVKEKGLLQRRGCSRYDNYHTLWHLASGLGTALSSYYFSLHYPELTAASPNLFAVSLLPAAPIFSLALSIFVNATGNAIGIMPLDQGSIIFL